MSRQIVNPRSIRPIDVAPGNVMIRTVVLIVTPTGYQVHIAPYPMREPYTILDSSDKVIPQGMRLFSPIAREVGEGVFPVIRNTSFEAE